MRREKEIREGERVGERSRGERSGEEEVGESREEYRRKEG